MSTAWNFLFSSQPPSHAKQAQPRSVELFVQEKTANGKTVIVVPNCLDTRKNYYFILLIIILKLIGSVAKEHASYMYIAR
jgi:hypothetical protein